MNDKLPERPKPDIETTLRCVRIEHGEQKCFHCGVSPAEPGTMFCQQCRILLEKRK